jgi:DNA-binding NtrC family response regulator
VVITAHGTMETAVEAIRRGAFDYLVKPMDTEKAMLAVARAARAGGLTREVQDLKARLDGHAASLMAGASAPMQEVFKQIGMASLSDAAVLVLGDTGTGKELAARAIHAASPRSAGPFVPVHCAAIPETLLESELFGFEKGAFTGAVEGKPGRLARADGGTLFLDEVSEIPAGIQVKLLRVLEERQVESLGGGKAKPLNARIVSASNADLAALVESGRFRKDLYFRLNVFTIRLPPLRERKEDIPLLAARFLDLAHAARQEVSKEALQALAAHDWPGNVRELRNAIEHALVLSRGRPLLPEHFPAGVGGSGAPESRADPIVREAVARAAAEGEGKLYDRVLPLFEKPLIAEVLRMTGGNQVRAAALLGIHRTTLRKKIAEYGLQG